MSRPAPSTVIARSAALVALAQRAQRRVFARTAMGGLKQFAWVPWLTLPLVTLLHPWLPPEAMALTTLGLWSALALGSAMRSQRSTYGALADWDAASGRNDVLSSALVFARDPAVETNPGRLLHLERSAELVAAAGKRLPADLPLPRLRWTWLGPAAAVSFAVLPWWHPIVAPGDQPLNDDQRAAAAAEVAKLDTPASALLKPQIALTSEEQRALEAWVRAQEELKASLEVARDKSPRDLLDALENQARAAQALAQQLGTDSERSTSEKSEASKTLTEAVTRQSDRDKTRAALEKMADRLRQAGSSIMAQPADGMKKLAGQPGRSNPSPMPSLQPLSRAGDPSKPTGSLPLPGRSRPPDSNSNRPAPRRGTPIPGTGRPPQDAQPLAVVPGTGATDAQPLALATPIPGTSPGRAANPTPGAAASLGIPGTGGRQAGRGATKIEPKSTELMATATQGEVTAAAGTDGESFTRSIDGQPREEAAARTARQSAAAFLKEEERTLDTENLPASRREHIRRYFESLRKQMGE